MKSRRTRPNRLILLATLAMAAAPVAGLAQVLEGHALDVASDSAVSGVSVALVDSVGDVVATAVSATDGFFQLTMKRAGRYRIRGERIGRRRSGSGRRKSPVPVWLLSGALLVAVPGPLVAQADTVGVILTAWEALRLPVHEHPAGTARVACLAEREFQRGISLRVLSALADSLGGRLGDALASNCAQDAAGLVHGGTGGGPAVVVAIETLDLPDPWTAMIYFAVASGKRAGHSYLCTVRRPDGLVEWEADCSVRETFCDASGRRGQ